MKHLRLAATALAAAGVLGAAGAQSPGPVETTHGTRPAPAATAPVVQPRSGEDVEFLLEALRTGIAEVAMGELAQQRSTNPAVREFGKTLQADHSKSVQELKGILGTMNVVTPTHPTVEAESHHAALAKLSGAEFDAAFLPLMITAHEEAIEKYQAQTHANPDEQLAALAAKTLPTLEKHLATAKSLLGAARS